MKRIVTLLTAILLLGGCVDVRREYFANGKVKSETQFRNGRMFGTRRVFYPTGELQYEGTFEYDAPMGTHRFYYTSGKPMQEIEYIDGKMDGTRRLFDEQGNLRLSASYTAGKMNDDCTEFSGPNSARRATTCDFEGALGGPKKSTVATRVPAESPKS